MSEVKRYYVGKYGLVEGEALGRLGVVLASDYDAAVTHIRDLELLAGQEMKSTELATNAGLRVCLERDALQAMLTAADDRADTAASLIRRIVANFETEIEYHEDVEPNDLEHDQVLADMRDFLAGRAAATQHQGEPVAFTAVGVLRDDGDGGLAPEWILEGGTAELWAGAVLLIADEDQELCAEDGHCELYRNPPEQPAQVAVAIQGGANLQGQSFIRNCQVTCCGSALCNCAINLKA